MTCRHDTTFPRGAWVDLCILQLLNLRPDVPAATLHAVATVLWLESSHLLPHEAAECEVQAWPTAQSI